MALKILESPSALGRLLSQLRSGQDFKDRVMHMETISARPPEFRDWPQSISPDLIQILEKFGIEALWTHQAQTVEALAQGKHAAVMTPTASGKTLCFNLPVLQSILEKPDTRALYLYPMKALAQDQLKTLQDWMGRLKAAHLPV